jgi:hypothetical protein
MAVALVAPVSVQGGHPVTYHVERLWQNATVVVEGVS